MYRKSETIGAKCMVLILKFNDLEFRIKGNHNYNNIDNETLKNMVADLDKITSGVSP